MSTVVSDLLKIALELKEDLLISNLIDSRDDINEEEDLICHEETWKKTN